MAQIWQGNGPNRLNGQCEIFMTDVVATQQYQEPGRAARGLRTPFDVMAGLVPAIHAAPL
jgi:hypothetical protein